MSPPDDHPRHATGHGDNTPDGSRETDGSPTQGDANARPREQSSDGPESLPPSMLQQAYETASRPETLLGA
ncbi:MAG: hypothetical protein AAF762_11060, partial [Pseudomonadota bacterium]